MMGGRQGIEEREEWEAVAARRNRLAATADPSGCHPRTAAEWLDWRDAQLWLLSNFREEIARAIPTRHFGDQPLPGWWRSSMVAAVAAGFQRAEFMVWEDPQWAEVLRQSPAFVDSPMEIAASQFMLWTWPGDRCLPPAEAERYGVPGGFDLGAILVYCLGPVSEAAAANARARVEGLQSPAEVPLSAGELLDRTLNTDVTLTLYCTVDDSVMRESIPYGRPMARRDLAPYLPRLVVLPHSRDQPIRSGWEMVPAALGFLRERIYVPEPLPQTRQQRRHYERQHPDRTSTVQVVTLRRTEAIRPKSAGDSDREYHCRWWVGGHWRRRAERWRSGTGPIWVKAHVKGPEDAPLRPRENRVVRVMR